MRKTVILILAALILISSAAAEYSKPDFILEGYDGDSTNRFWETNQFFTRMTEKAGIRFQFRQSDTYEKWKERKAQIASGENLPDVLFKAELTPAETWRMRQDGILIDLSPYLETCMPNLWKLLQDHPEWMEAITLPDGSIGALPAINPMQDNNYMWINTRWLQKVEAEVPRTVDELTDVLRKFRDGDPNKNDKKDEIPLTFLSMWELRFLGHAFGLIDNDYYVSVSNGKVASSLTSDENRHFLAWLHELWEEDLLDHKGFSNTDSLRKITDTDSQKNPYGMIMSSTPLTVLPTEQLDYYTILAPLQQDGSGEQIYRDLTGEIIRGTFAITKACQDPETVLRWVDYLYSDEGAILAEYGVEETEYSWITRETGERYWAWNRSPDTVAQEIFTERILDSSNQTTRIVLQKNSMGIGNATPGIVPVEMQLLYDDDSARRLAEMMNSVRSFCVLPFPYVTLSDGDAAELTRIQSELMGYTEQAMACFVTGDLELNDENWQTFCDTVHEKGLDDAIAIWQKYVQ